MQYDSNTCMAVCIFVRGCGYVFAYVFVYVCVSVLAVV